MRIFAFGCLSAGLAIAVYVAQPAASIAAPKTSAATCSVSGAKYPELIPEYYVWETFFRIHTAGASGQTEGIAPPDARSFTPPTLRGTHSTWA
jgi:hypothetical protein